MTTRDQSRRSDASLETLALKQNCHFSIIKGFAVLYSTWPQTCPPGQAVAQNVLVLPIAQ